MPTPYLKKLAAEGKGSMKELESKWSQAKGIAAKDGNGDNFAMITAIFEKLVGIEEPSEQSFREFNKDKRMKIEDTLVFYHKKGRVFGYYDIDGVLIPQSAKIYDIEAVEKYIDGKYKTKDDARYAALIYNLGNGKKIQNYKGSKYYMYYIERLKKENPEFII